MNKQKNAGGLIFETLIPGEHYTCTQVGGISDSETGIQIAGPRVTTDPDTRRVLEVSELPAPTQLPHARIVRERKIPNDLRSEFVEREYPFTERDANGTLVGEVFAMALATGILRHVPQAEMEKYFPEAWAQRQENYVWRPSHLTKMTPMADLVAEAQQRQFEEREHRASIGGSRPATK